MNGHHLILGETKDFLTGETIQDTHDEQYRQKLLRLLVGKRGFSKADLKTGLEVRAEAGDKQAIIRADIAIFLDERISMIVKYGPGSIETRIRPALALSRLIGPYTVPFVVVTNGEDARIVSAEKGKTISSGLDSLPSKPELMKMCQTASFEKIDPRRAEMESRILYAFEVDDSCPCDDTICRL